MKASFARPGGVSYSRICGIAICFVMLCAAAVSAASYARITLKQLTERSKAVVEVQVLGNSYPALKPGETFPRTHVDLKVLRTLKGSLGDRFMLDTPGGINGDVISYVPDSPDFKINEHAIVFIKEPDTGHFMVQDLGLGKYNIVERDGKKFVESPICSKAIGVNSPIEKQEDLEANLLTRSIPYALFCGMVENYAVGVKPSADPAKLAATLPPSTVGHIQSINTLAPEAQSKVAALNEMRNAEAAAAESRRAKLALGGVTLLSALLAAFIVVRRKNSKAASGKNVAMVLGGALLTGAILGGAGARAFVTFEQRTIWNLDRPVIGKVADGKILVKQSTAVSKTNPNSFTGVLNSLNKWANVTGSRLGFTNAGSTSKAVNDSTDQENTLAWTSTPSNDFSQNTLGITFSSFTTGATSIFIDGDIIFNDRDFDWSANGDGNPDSVSLHEIGHFIGLNHTTDKGTVMFPFDGGLTQLTTDEKNAAQALYPGATQASPPPAAPPPTTPPPTMVPPKAVADASPKSGPPGTTVSFTSAGSAPSDPTKPIIKFDWQFGDGTSGQGPEVTHTYTTIGTFVATLFVTDITGAFSASMVTINIGSGSDVLKANFKLVFTTKGKDSFSAIVDVSSMLQGKPIAGGVGIVDGWLNIGDQPWKFTFDARKGKSINVGGVTMSLNAKKGLLVLATKNSDLRDVLGGHGAVNDNVFGVEVPVPVNVWFKDNGYVFARIPFVYNAKLDKAGTGKF